MSQNSDALKGAYESFNSGDLDGVAAIFADDIRWEGPNTEGVPMSGTHEGKDAVLQAMGGIGDAFESFSVSRLIEEQILRRVQQRAGEKRLRRGMRGSRSVDAHLAPRRFAERSPGSRSGG